MHGLIFVTWEKYIAERFGTPLLQSYRTSIGETIATAPLASRVYDDATLIAGVQALCELSGVPANTLLREYGHYFIINGLTSHLCAYFLTRVHNGRELLLIMREGHLQMRRTPEGLTPPLFTYETIPSDPQGLILIYDSPRKLCSVLFGAIEGAAERYGEQVRIIERSCMKHGASSCRFEIHFRHGVQSREDYTKAYFHKERTQQQRERQQMVDLVLSLLPASNGITMLDLQNCLQTIPGVQQDLIRPRIVFEALRHLQYAGLITSTANQPGDVLTQRRFWRVPTRDTVPHKSLTTPPPTPQTHPQAPQTSHTKNKPAQRTSAAKITTDQTAAMPPDMLGHAGPQEPIQHTKPRQKTGSMLVRYRQQHSNASS